MPLKSKTAVRTIPSVTGVRAFHLFPKPDSDNLYHPLKVPDDIVQVGRGLNDVPSLTCLNLILGLIVAPSGIT